MNYATEDLGRMTKDSLHDDLAVDLRQHFEALFREKERAIEAAASERAAAAEELRASLTRRFSDSYDRLHELLTTLFDEKDRALQMASDEREKAASVLREEQYRALAVAEAEREKAAQALRSGFDRAIHDNYERLHELLVTLFEEKDRALEMAASEREKAAQVLREEQHRALTQAEHEREKKAEALRNSLAQSIREGDDRLREHIANQIQQITATLKSGDLLELARIRGVHDELVAQINANTKEFRQVQAATSTAVDKAEQAQLRVNEGQNEFRGQLRDQASTLMPRREVESVLHEHVRQLAELRDQIAQLRTELAVGPPGLSELSRTTAHHEGASEHKQASQTQQLTLLGVIAAVGLVIVEFVTRKHG